MQPEAGKTSQKQGFGQILGKSWGGLYLMFGFVFLVVIKCRRAAFAGSTWPAATQSGTRLKDLNGAWSVSEKLRVSRQSGPAMAVPNRYCGPCIASIGELIGADQSANLWGQYPIRSSVPM
jgi:hypothetical protein